MSSTNHTTNYNLSQYVGTDKPTYLGDYNSDMGKIDTAIHTNASAISGVGSDITLINTQIGTLGNLTTTDKSSVVNAINEVKGNTTTNATNIGTLSNLETSNKTTVVNAINEVVERIAMNDVVTYHLADVTNKQNISSSGTSISMTVAQNEDGSLFKVYGVFAINRADNTGTNYKYTLPNALKVAPSENYIITPIGLEWNRTTKELAGTPFITVTTNGSIVIEGHSLTNANIGGQVFPCLYFNTSFGDTPDE